MEKRCPSCKKTKAAPFFYRRSGKLAHLLKSYCIECERKKQKGDVKRLEGAKKLYHRRRAEWVSWLKTLYGIAPQCQVCGLPLSFVSGMTGVIFDHRNGGGEKIKNVSSWIAYHALNERNKEVFLFCNFGILCHKCNLSLPTKNRITWIKNVIEYIRQTHPEF